MRSGATRRLDQTRPTAGFHAELPGSELATLIQLTCARHERVAIRIASEDGEGLIFAIGRIVHATLGNLVGEAAVLRMLSWRKGDFSIVEVPFPAEVTVRRDIDSLLRIAAWRADDAALDEVLATVARPDESGSHPHEPAALPPSAPAPSPDAVDALDALDALDDDEEEQALLFEDLLFESEPAWPPPVPLATQFAVAQPAPPPAAAQPAAQRAARLSQPPPLPSTARASQPPPLPQQRTSQLPRESEPPRESHVRVRTQTTQPSASSPLTGSESAPMRTTLLPSHAARPRVRATSLPVRVSARRPTLAEALTDAESTMLAAVRIDAHGTLIDAVGDHDHLTQLVAYVTRLVRLIQVDFTLDPFEALHAELAGLRVLVLKEAGETLGLLMPPGSSVQAMRQRLGV